MSEEIRLTTGKGPYTEMNALNEKELTLLGKRNLNEQQLPNQ